MNNIKPNWFSLFKNNDNIDEGISEDFIEVLKQCSHPQIVCIYGDARTGKSTKMNQIINGVKADNYFDLKEPFETYRQIITAKTKGCNFYGPIKVKEICKNNNIDIQEIEEEIINDDLFFVDTEGLKTIDNTTKSCVSGILTVLQISSIKILYIPFLDNEKLEEAVKNSKLSNLLNIDKKEGQIIVLIRDVPLEEKNERRMKRELERQRDELEEKINNYFKKVNGNIKAICEILPSFELAAKNVEGYPESYKEQMQRLVISILTNLKVNKEITGAKLVDMIKEFLEIFKKIKDIDIMKNTDNAINMILCEFFKEKIKKIYSDILEKIKKFDKNIISLNGNKEGIENYFIQTVKDALKNTWDIYEKTINKDMKKEIEIYKLKLEEDIKDEFEDKKDEVDKQIKEITNVKNNKEISNYFERINFKEEMNQKTIDNIIDKLIKSFLDKNKFYLESIEKNDKDYIKKITDYIKETINDGLIYFFYKKPEWKTYLRNVIFDIKRDISNSYKNSLKTKGKEAILVYLNKGFDDLIKKIELYLAQKHIKIYNKKDFDIEIDEILKEIKEELNNQIRLIDLNQDKQKLEKEKERLKIDKIKSKSIPDGIYIIYATHCKNKVIDVSGASKDDNAKVWLYEFNDTNAQKFEILYDDLNKYYTIKCLCSDKYLNVNQSNYHINQLSRNNSPNQQWHIVNSDNNYYEIISELNGDKKNLEVSGGGTSNGTDIILSSKTRAEKQLFNFKSTTKTPPPPPPRPKTPPRPPSPPRPRVSCFPIPNFHHPYTNRCSIVDALKSINVDSSQNYRRRIGDRNNIPGTPFSPEYNTFMLNVLKNGQLIIP